MDAASSECVRECRGCRCEGLAFAGGHFGDGSVSQDQPAKELNIVKRFSVNAADRFNGQGKRIFQNLWGQDFQPRFDLFSQVICFRFEISVALPRQSFGVDSDGGEVRSMAVRPKGSAMKSRSVV